MKRFAIFVAAILLAQTLSAQIITSRSHSIIRESTTGKFALQKGYRGFAEGTLIINIKPTIANRCGFNISTIHGYQFNRLSCKSNLTSGRLPPTPPFLEK